MRSVIVGPPSSGKTTLIKRLEKRGLNIFIADEFINKIYMKDAEGYKLIKENFGDDFVTNKEVNRKSILELIAKNPRTIIRINEIIHPLIKHKFESYDDVYAELPIVTTSPVKFSYDRLILVTAKKHTIIKRLQKTKSNINGDFLDMILNKWDNDIEYDFVIDTTNGIKEHDIDKLINNE